MGLADLVEHVADYKQWRQLLEALILSDDLLQREAVLAGETENVEPWVLTAQQVRGEAPLPEQVVSAAGEEHPVVVEADRIWESYYRFAHRLGVSENSRYLVQWVEFEVALRNELARVRARRLGLEEAAYVVASDLAAVEGDLSSVVNTWEAAATPLAGLRVVIGARWSWVDEHEMWFSFSSDELLAYATRIMLLEQWCRSAESEEMVG
jgi:hypothetical protein